MGNGSARHYLYGQDGVSLIGEYAQAAAGASASALTEIVYLEGTPVLALKDGATYFIQADHLNAPRLVKNSAGAASWRWKSDAYGVGAADQNPGGAGVFEFNSRFPGQQFDSETGLYYNNARYYDPAVGRYISSDPIGLAGGVNTFLYANANPNGLSDPSGNFGIAGAVIGFGFGAGTKALSMYLAGDSMSWQGAGSVLLAGAGGAAAGATGTWLAGVSSRVAVAMITNGFANGGIGYVAGGLDNILNCKSFNDGAGKSFVLNYALGAVGGFAGQGLTNWGKSVQRVENMARALELGRGFVPATGRIAPALDTMGVVLGNGLSNFSPFL